MRQLVEELDTAEGIAALDPVVVGEIRHGFWPVVKMSDGTYRKGPFAEIVGRWSNDG